MIATPESVTEKSLVVNYCCNTTVTSRKAFVMSIFGEDPEIADSRRTTLELLCHRQADETAEVEQITAEYCGIGRQDLPPVNAIFPVGTPEYEARRTYRIARKRVTEDLRWLNAMGWADSRSTDITQPKLWQPTGIGRWAQSPVPSPSRPKTTAPTTTAASFGNAGSQASEMRERVLGLLVDGGDEDDEYSTWRLMDLGWNISPEDQSYHQRLYGNLGAALRWLGKNRLASWRRRHPTDPAKYWKATDAGKSLIRGE